jgi:hypothetical protein
MNLPTRPHPSHVPTLTEVIELDAEGGATLATPLVEQPIFVPEPTPQPVFVEEPLPVVSEAQLSQRVLTDVQRQIDSMLEFRLRESMQPLLAQFTETLMQDLRDELSRTMRDVVTRAVAQEVAKLRNR